MRELLHKFIFLTSPISTILGMTLLGFKSAQGDVGGALLSSLLILYGYVGALFVGYLDGQADAMKKMSKKEEKDGS